MAINSFTQLEAWQRARELHTAVCDACRREPLRRRFRLVDQLKASASSVMANIAEGFDRGSPDEFHKSLCIAKGEASEVMSHLVAAKDDRIIGETEFEELHSLATRVTQLVGALRRSLEPRLKRKKRR